MDLTILLDKDQWKNTSNETPKDYKPIAFFVENVPIPIAGFYMDGSFYQVNASKKNYKMEQVESVTAWMYLPIGYKE